MNFKRLNNIASLLFLVSIITFPRSFIELKLIFLIFFIFSYPFASSKIKVYPEVIIFYGILAFIGSVWSVVGIINGGAFRGISDSFRIWVFWSIAYSVIIILLRNNDKIKIIHYAFAISGILIFLINLVGVLNFQFKWGLFSKELIKELELHIGFHEGYIQIMSHNIGSLFFIVPYLMTVYFRRDAGEFNSFLTKTSLLLSLILAIISGRRALWLVVFFAPLIIIAMSYFTASVHLLRKNPKRFINIMIFAITFLLFGVAFLFQKELFDSPTLEHLQAAFSSRDPRSIQKGYLFDGFMQYPIFGSGFGVSAGYIRSQLSPWMYELTYNLILFNFGIIGTVLLFSLFIIYIYLIILLIRQNRNGSVIAFAIIIGFFSFLIGAYSNPYLGSFDFLIHIGMLPYLATFKSGYSKPPLITN